MKLLLAEDDKKLLKSLTYILEKNNYIVDSVSNGKDAFLCALTGEYDGMILDIMMPGLSGLEIVKKSGKKRLRAQSFSLLQELKYIKEWRD